MNIIHASIASFAVGGLVGLAMPDAKEVIESPKFDDTRVGERLKFKEMTPDERLRSTCYALVPRHETYSVVLNQGVTCVSVVGIER